MRNTGVIRRVVRRAIDRRLGVRHEVPRRHRNKSARRARPRRPHANWCGIIARQGKPPRVIKARTNGGAVRDRRVKLDVVFACSLARICGIQRCTAHEDLGRQPHELRGDAREAQASSSGG